MRATFFKPSELRQMAAQKSTYTAVAALTALNESTTEQRRRLVAATYDAFLSYSSLDWLEVYGLYLKLTQQGYSVYVDRIEDPQLDRTNVTVATAEVLRARMRQCRSLLFATTENYSNSKWLPWEVGYFDGYRHRVAVVPVNEIGEFIGQEYLGLYPVLESDFWLRKPNGDVWQKLRGWIDA